MGPYPLPGWSWLNIRPPQQIRGRPVWGWDFHTVRGCINPGDIRVRPRVVGVVLDVWTDSDPGMGGPIVPGWHIYYMYEPWPMGDQSGETAICFYFRLNLEPEILSCQHLKRCCVLYMSDLLYHAWHNRSWLCARLSVATKRTCRRRGHSPCWLRMLDQSKHNKKRTQHVSSWPD